MHKMKRIIAMCLVLCMLLSVLPISALAITITDKPANGTTEGQPFAPGTGGSQNFRIPGIVTLDDGTLIAACDARWNHAGDGAGLDTIVSVSTDNGANWTYTFANYLGDNGDTYNNLSTCIIDPGIGTDGEKAYLIADLWPAGIALNTSKYGPIATENGFDDEGHLLLRALADDTITIGANGYNTMAGEVSRYQFYLDLEALTLHNADGSAIEGYTVDAYFNIKSADGSVDTNLFFSDSPYQPYPTDYLYMTTSTDGLTWSEPQLLNLQEDGEQTLLVGPGNGTYDKVNDRMIFTAYEHTSGYERACLIWMDENGNWTRSEDATANTWSSEATSVVLDDGTVRCFYRDGYNVLRYTDYVFDESANNYVVSAREVSTTATKTHTNQVSSILYSQKINGKEAILVSTANSDGRNRRNGTIYVFLVNDDKSMELAYAYDILEGTDDYYAYSCITEMSDGSIALLYESAGSAITYHVIDMEKVLDRDNDPNLTIQEVELLSGYSQVITDNTGYYVDADISELDTDVATLTMTGEEITTNAAQILGSGSNIDLDSCQYTFTATEDGYYEVSATAADGTVVYLNHFSTADSNIPNISTAGKIDVQTSAHEDMFKLVAKNIDGSTDSDRGLHFHMEAATPYWNRCGNDATAKCHEYLYRKAADGETASTEIPGYVRITSLDEIVDGGKYLIAARNDAGNWYVLNPSVSADKFDHVAQIMGTTTVGKTELTFTGVGKGYTEVLIGTTVYKITVYDVEEVELTIPVGESATVTEESGNYADADTSALDTTIATVALSGVDGTAENGLSLEPVSTLTDGTYVILNTRAGKLVTNAPATAAAAAGAGSGLNMSGSVTDEVASIAIWTITATDGGYTLQDADGNYMTIGSATAGVTADAATLSLNYTNGTWTIAQNGAYLNHFGGGSSTCAAGWQDGTAAGDAGSQFAIYAYTAEPYGPSTEITFTGVAAGSTEVLIGHTRYLITVTDGTAPEPVMPPEMDADDSSWDIPVSELTATCGDYEPDGGATEGPAYLVLDNNTATMWHTDWQGTSRENHWIQFEVTGDYAVCGLRYLPRQTGNNNGTITRYDIQVSDDGVTFRSVASGDWAADSTWKIAQFPGEKVKYVRLIALDAVSDNAWVFASAAEIRLTYLPTETVDTDKAALDALIAECEQIEQGNYTAKSWQDFQKALEKAQSVSANPYASQAQVDEALAALAQAKEGLKEQVEGEGIQKIFHLDSGRKYFSKDWTIALLNELDAAGYTHLQLAFGNNGFRFLLDDMTIEANGTTYASDDIKAGIKIGNTNYYNEGEKHALTEAEMDEIIAHAKSVGVEIVPHLNMPGHMSALLDAMEHIGIENPHFTGYVESDSSVDLNNEAALNFMTALVDKYAAYFSEKGVKYFHIGADEYANDAYNGGMGFPAMGATLYSKFAAFVNANAAIVESYGMTPRAWNDGIYYGSYTDEFDADIEITYWSSGWWGYNLAKASALDEKGHGLINTNGDYYYILGVNDRFTTGTTTEHDPNLYTECAGYDLNRFMDGSTIEEPVGGMFCVWADYPGAETETEVAANIRLVLRAMALRMEGLDIDDLDTSVVPGGFNADGSINSSEAPHEHTWSEWTVTKEATCTEAGSKERTCECGEKETEVIAALGHTEEIVPGKDATCTEDGLTEGKECTVCGETLVKQEVVPALGHDYENGVCTVCGDKLNPFTDVTEGSYYYEPVLWAVAEGITNGATDTTFNPTGNCKRAQVVTFLWRAFGSPEPQSNVNPFTDVEESDYFYKAVLWAVENGITTGTSATEFSPQRECSRAQVVTFLWRAVGEPASDAEITFTDVEANQYYATAVAWAVENGITTGKTATTFDPTGICNRAQVVTFLWRALA